VAYFTAVVARTGRNWRARDVEVDEADSLDALAESLRSVAVDDQPVLAVVEHEDEWFALIRVDGDEEPRLFVSDLPAASRSTYSELLSVAADVEIEDDDDLPPGADGDGEAEVVTEPELSAWAGEADLLEDLGVSGRAMRRLVEENGQDPGAVLAEVGDQVGFGELLAALR
jgi:putative tRNA adenosine deaminase-associated protein